MSDINTEIMEWREGILAWNGIRVKQEIPVNIEMKTMPAEVVKLFYRDFTALAKYLKQDTDLDYYRNLGEEILAGMESLEHKIEEYVQRVFASEGDTPVLLTDLTAYYMLQEKVSAEGRANIAKLQEDTAGKICAGLAAVHKGMALVPAYEAKQDTRHGTKYISVLILETCSKYMELLKGMAEGTGTYTPGLKNIYLKGRLKGQLSYNMLGAGLYIEIFEMMFTFLKELAGSVEQFLNIILYPQG